MTDSVNTSLESNSNQTKPKSKAPPAENGFASIFINILIPVFILNKGHTYGLSAKQSLFIALAFPLIGGLFSYIKQNKFNFISLLGLINILASGTLSVLGLGGIWFSIKEAIFPLLIGIFVYFSSFKSEPFFANLFLNPQAFNVELIENKIQENKMEIEFKQLMKKSTIWLSGSFLMSAFLNFALAQYIFKPIEDSVSLEQKQIILNQQLSQMTMYSMFVILIPSIIFLGLILYFAFNKLKHLTGLNLEQLFNNN